MSENQAQTSPVSNTKINNMLLLANNFLFAMVLACPMISSVSKYFANTYLCLGIILLLSFLNYRLYKAIGGIQNFGDSLTVESRGWKLKAKVLAWAALVPAVMLLGVGPITNPAAYEVDRFTRIFGVGVINDYSVSKKVHYFYVALIAYGLLVFNFYLNIILSLRNNLHNGIRRLGEFAGTLLFVGWSFLLVCAYRQFSNQYSYDLTLYLLKSFMVFMIPAFYLWETGNLKVHDVRIMLALALFSLVLSVDIVFCFDTKNFCRFSDILAIVLFVSVIIFTISKSLGVFNYIVLDSKFIVVSLVGSFALIFCSLTFEFLNILALKTDRFIDAGKAIRTVFYCACWLSLAIFFFVKKPAGRKTAGAVMFLFVLGISLIMGQCPLIISAGWNIYESANYAVPVSDFIHYGKIPIIENFPGHMLYQVISSIAYGLITQDYHGAIFAPWSDWLYGATAVVVFYCFVRLISNGLSAFTMVILLPYLTLAGSFSSFGIGLAVLLPFIIFLKTNKRLYLVLTVLLSFFLVALKLDIGFSFLTGMLCSSLFVSLFSQKKIIYKVSLYYLLGGSVALILFLGICLVKDINPIIRIQEFVSIASSNDRFGLATLGNTEKTSYSFVYFIMPLLSVLCFVVAVFCRSRFSFVQFAVLLCLLFAYYANIPRFLVRHSLAEYARYAFIAWLWTFPLAISYLISRLCASRALFILCQTSYILLAYIMFQGTTFYENSSLQTAVNRAEALSGQTIPDVREKDIRTVFSQGSRVVYSTAKSKPDMKSASLVIANDIRNITDSLLAQDETFLDFTCQNAAYAFSGRRSPTYATQFPCMLSGEIGQRTFIREVENDLDKVPVAIMPTDKGWYHTLNHDRINNNIRNYLVAELIYNNYRPLIKLNSFSSVWVLSSRYNEFYKKLNSQEFTRNKNVQSKLSFIDWGYDNFVNIPNGSEPEVKFISMAHDYDMVFLPFIWGQFDSKNSAGNADLAKISLKDGIYSWDYSGSEKKPAYLRVDLSVSPDVFKKIKSTYLVLGNLENGSFSPLTKFRFKLKEGSNVYLFRISSDYYWSLGKLKALCMDPKLRNSLKSIRILNGD